MTNSVSKSEVINHGRRQGTAVISATAMQPMRQLLHARHYQTETSSNDVSSGRNPSGSLQLDLSLLSAIFNITHLFPSQELMVSQLSHS